LMDCAATTALIVQCGPSDPPTTDDEIGAIADVLSACTVKNYVQLTQPDQLTNAVQRRLPHALRRAEDVSDLMPERRFLA